MNNLRKRARIAQKRPIPVTIIVGLMCKRCVILASDSQTTYSSSIGATKRNDTQKISLIQFVNGQAIVAQAGCAALSARAVEILTDLAKNRELNDYRTVADLTQDAFRKLKEELRASNCNCTLEQLREIIDDDELHFELMIASYYGKEPQVFNIDFKIGIATKQAQPFTALGCGSAIATYILGWFDIPQMTVQQCALTALYVIEEVKKVDPYCGGPPRLAMVAPASDDRPSGGKIYPETSFGKARSELAKLDAAAKTEWSKKMEEVIKKILSDESGDDAFLP